VGRGHAWAGSAVLLIAGACAGCDLIAGLGDAKLGDPGTSGAGSTTSTSASSSSGSGGATCGDGTTIVGGLTNPNSLAVDATNVYWTDADDGTVMLAPLATGKPAQVASMQSSPQGLFTDGSGDLWWVEPSAGNVDGAFQGEGAFVVASGQAGPDAVLEDMTGVYWTTQGTTEGGAIMVQPTSAAGMPPETVLSPLAYPLENLVLGSTGLLIFSSSTGNLFSLVETEHGQTPTLLSNSPAVGGIAADETFAYWTDGISSVAKVAFTAGTPFVLASQQAKPSDLAVDTLYIYWINQGTGPGTGAVMEGPLTGGVAPHPLAACQDSPRGLVVTAGNVYWISGAKGNGAIKTVPR
jgi:hypothetical protein